MAEAVRRTPPSATLLDGRVVAVLRARAAGDYPAVVEVLVDAGIRSIELTLTTPGTLDVLPAIVAAVGSAAEVGVGTVLSGDDAERALARGAAFLVTPTVRPAVIAAAVGAGRPVYPGALTPTEVEADWSAGASAVKVFPASVVGPAYLRALAGPFPGVLAMPSGGVAVDDAPAWLAAGAIAVSLGGELLGDAFRGGDLRALADRARRARAVVDAAPR